MATSDGIRRVAYKDGYWKIYPDGRQVFIKGQIPASVNPWAQLAGGNAGGADASNDAPSGPAPFDYAAEAARIAAENRRSTVLGDLDVDLQQTSQQYGFKYDPATGTFGGIDPSNPFSRAALLQKSYERGVKTTQGNLAARGQQYSGALQSTLDQQRSSFDQGYDTLRRQYEDYVKRYQRRRRDVVGATADQILGTQFNAVEG